MTQGSEISHILSSQSPLFLRLSMLVFCLSSVLCVGPEGVGCADTKGARPRCGRSAFFQGRGGGWIHAQALLAVDLCRSQRSIAYGSQPRHDAPRTKELPLPRGAVLSSEVCIFLNCVNRLPNLFPEPRHAALCFVVRSG